MSKKSNDMNLSKKEESDSEFELDETQNDDDKDDNDVDEDHIEETNATNDSDEMDESENLKKNKKKKRKPKKNNGKTTKSSSNTTKKELDIKYKNLVEAIVNKKEEEINTLLTQEMATYVTKNKSFPNRSIIETAIAQENLELTKKIMRLGGQISVETFKGFLFERSRKIKKAAGGFQSEFIRLNNTPNEFFNGIMESLPADVLTELSIDDLMLRHVPIHCIKYFFEKNARITSATFAQCIKKEEYFSFFDQCLEKWLALNHSGSNKQTKEERESTLRTTCQDILFECLSDNVTKSEIRIKTIQAIIHRVLKLGSIDLNTVFFKMKLFDYVGKSKSGAGRGRKQPVDGFDAEVPPILLAAYHEKPEMIKFLIDLKVNVNSTCKITGISPLIMSLLQDDSTSALLLMNNSADVTHVASGKLILFEKCLLKKSKKSYLELGENITAMKCAVLVWNTEVILKLLQLGIDPDTIIVNDESLLFYALKKQDKTIIDLLFQQAGKIEPFRVVNGNTPLSEAVVIQNYDYVSKFYSSKLPVNAQEVALGNAIMQYFTGHSNRSNLTLANIKSKQAESLKILKFLCDNVPSKKGSSALQNPFTRIDFNQYKPNKEQIETLQGLVSINCFLEVPSLIHLLISAIDLTHWELFNHTLKKAKELYPGESNKENLTNILGLALLNICIKPLDAKNLKGTKRSKQNDSAAIELKEEKFLMKAAITLLEAGVNPNYIIKTNIRHSLRHAVLVESPYLKFADKILTLMYNTYKVYTHKEGEESFITETSDSLLYCEASPLYYATCSKRKDLIALLLKNNADITFGAKYDIVTMGYYTKQKNKKYGNSYLCSLLETAKIVGESAIIEMFQKQTVEKEHVEEAFKKKDIETFKSRLTNYMATHQSGDLNPAARQFAMHLMLKIVTTIEPDAPKKEKVYDSFLAEAAQLLLSVGGFSPDLLIENADQNSIKTQEPILYVATTFGRREVIEVLLKNHANVNATTVPHKRTCLMAAAEKNDYHTVKLLLSFAADMKIKNNEDDDVSEYCINPWKSEILKLLIDSGYPVDMSYGENYASLIYYTILAKDEINTNSLLDRNADITHEINGFTAFEYILMRHAIPFGQKILPRLLHSNMMQSIILSNQNMLLKAMNTAITHNADKILDFLLENTQELEWPFPNIPTPLVTAINKNNTSAAITIMNAGRYLHTLSPATENAPATHPLFLAIEKSQEGVIKLFLDKRTLDLAMVDHQGATPLLKACVKPYSIFKLFLDAHVNLEAVDKSGNTALLNAIGARQFFVAVKLVTLGVNINKSNLANQSPIDFLFKTASEELNQRSMVALANKNPTQINNLFQQVTRVNALLNLMFAKGVVLEINNLKQFFDQFRTISGLLATLFQSSAVSIQILNLLEKAMFLFLDEKWDNANKDLASRFKLLHEKLFMENPVSPINIRRLSDLKTPLHLAMERKDSLMMFILLYDGVDTHLTDKNLMTVQKNLSPMFKYLAELCTELRSIRIEFNKYSTPSTTVAQPTSDIDGLKKRTNGWIVKVEGLKSIAEKNDYELITQIQNYLYHSLKFFYDFKMFGKNPALDRKIVYTAFSKISSDYFDYQKICALRTTLLLHKETKAQTAAAASLESSDGLDDGCELWLDNYLNSFKYSNAFNSKDEQEINDMMFSKYAAEYMKGEDSIEGIKGVTGVNPMSIKSLMFAYKELNQKYQKMIKPESSAITSSAASTSGSASSISSSTSSITNVNNNSNVSTHSSSSGSIPTENQKLVHYTNTNITILYDNKLTAEKANPNHVPQEHKRKIQALETPSENPANNPLENPSTNSDEKPLKRAKPNNGTDLFIETASSKSP